MPQELPPHLLRGVCPLDQFQFNDTSELEPLDAVIGQQRAVQAIDFGLNMKSQGYNIFVTGDAGTGKSSIVRDIVLQYAARLPAPDDWCMVNNFEDEYCPKAMRVPSGKATAFSKSIHRLIEDIQAEIPRTFDSKLVQEQLADIRNSFTDQQKSLMDNVDVFAEPRHIRISRDESGYQALPLMDGKPIGSDEFDLLPLEKRSEIEGNIQKVQTELETALREVNRFNQIVDEREDAFMKTTAEKLLDEKLAPFLETYSEFEDILSFIYALKADVVENLDSFLSPFSSENGETVDRNEERRARDTFFRRYRVNVLVTQKQDKGAPVICESNPTYPNVIGRIERRAYMGAVTTDFTLVQAGSLLKASGGYLLMEIEPLLQNPFIWEALKRSLQNQYLAIEDIPSDPGYQSVSLRPEQIPLDVKVILMGDYELFESLQNYDSIFNKIFRVRADFDDEAPLNPDTILQYARFIARVCRDEALLPFTPDAVAAVIEDSFRAVEDRTRLSLRFGPTVGLLKEADYWANQNHSPRVTEQYVMRALKEYRFRYNLYEEKIHESYMDGSVLMDIESSVVGQVNGLAVYQIGEISFGRPSRITAETYLGKSGVVNIERETNLSGSTYDKGVLILSGYLGRTFARLHPLSLTISIAFEQNYGVIDGDSASSAELYAVISSLSDVPVFQGIAVTGSVNQKGEVQAIGGVNEKIEGFYDLCSARGLTGRQGVMIPASNVRNLMLKQEVVKAVLKGEFHIYPVSTISEGIEILTGIPAGVASDDGIYPDATIYGRVQHKLEFFLKRALKFGREWDIHHAQILC
jgi:predicted ATP-dependent protease